MPRFQHAIAISAPPERVWEILVDVERWPGRIPTVDRVERLDDGPLAVGARTRLAQPKLPEAIWTVTELTAGTAFTWTSASTGVRITASHLSRTHTRGLPPHPGHRPRRLAGARRLVDDQIADPAVRHDRGRLDQGSGRGRLKKVGVALTAADHSQ